MAPESRARHPVRLWARKPHKANHLDVELQITPTALVFHSDGKEWVYPRAEIEQIKTLSPGNFRIDLKDSDAPPPTVSDRAQGALGRAFDANGYPLVEPTYTGPTVEPEYALEHTVFRPVYPRMLAEWSQLQHLSLLLLAVVLPFLFAGITKAMIPMHPSAFTFNLNVLALLAVVLMSIFTVIQLIVVGRAEVKIREDALELRRPRPIAGTWPIERIPLHGGHAFFQDNRLMIRAANDELTTLGFGGEQLLTPMYEELLRAVDAAEEPGGEVPEELAELRRGRRNAAGVQR